jgi:hypothetical protein
MSSGFWFRNEPPPNSLISKRCSDLVNSSQSGVSGILVLPSDSLRRPRLDPHTLTTNYQNRANGGAALNGGAGCSAHLKRLRRHILATIVKMNNDEARLWEIAENLHRAELSKVERDENIAEWIKITE